MSAASLIAATGRHNLDKTLDKSALVLKFFCRFFDQNPPQQTRLTETKTLTKTKNLKGLMTMKTLISTIALASVAALSIGSASANDTFDVKFSYAPAAPVATIHKTMAKTAKRACLKEYRNHVSVGFNTAPLRSCQEELLAQAVEATKIDELVAYHND